MECLHHDRWWTFVKVNPSNTWPCVYKLWSRELWSYYDRRTRVCEGELMLIAHRANSSLETKWWMGPSQIKVDSLRCWGWCFTLGGLSGCHSEGSLGGVQMYNEDVWIKGDKNGFIFRTPLTVWVLVPPLKNPGPPLSLENRGISKIHVIVFLSYNFLSSYHLEYMRPMLLSVVPGNTWNNLTKSDV